MNLDECEKIIREHVQNKINKGFSIASGTTTMTNGSTNDICSLCVLACMVDDDNIFDCNNKDYKPYIMFDEVIPFVQKKLHWLEEECYDFVAGFDKLDEQYNFVSEVIFSQDIFQFGQKIRNDLIKEGIALVTQDSL